MPFCAVSITSPPESPEPGRWPEPAIRRGAGRRQRRAGNSSARDLQTTTETLNCRVLYRAAGRAGDDVDHVAAVASTCADDGEIIANQE